MADILVVVDNPRTAIDLWDMLQDDGHAVRHAACGQAGLAALERQPPDLIVADRAMPGRDAGTFVDAVRRDCRWAAIPVVVVSSAAIGNGADSPLAAGFIRKPWSQVALLNQVARLVGTCGDSEFHRVG